MGSRRAANGWFEVQPVPRRLTQAGALELAASLEHCAADLRRAAASIPPNKAPTVTEEVATPLYHVLNDATRLIEDDRRWSAPLRV